MDVSSLASSISAVQQSQVRNQVDVAVAAKTLDQQRQQGEAVVQMIEQAAQVQSQGRGVDYKA